MSPEDTKLRALPVPGTTADIKARVNTWSDAGTVPTKRQKKWNQIEELFKQWQTRGLIPADDQPGPTEAHRKAVVEYENAEYLQQEKAWIKAGQPPRYGPAKNAMKKAEKRKVMVANLILYLKYTSQGLTNSLHVVAAEDMPVMEELGRKIEAELGRRQEELDKRQEELDRRLEELDRRMEELDRRMEAELIRGMEERRKADEAHNDIIEEKRKAVEAHNDIIAERQREEDKYQQLLAERRQEDVRFQDTMADRQRREQEEQITQRKRRTNYSTDYSNGQGDENDDSGNEQHYPGTCPKTKRTKTSAHTPPCH
ncbi:hypothetical protein CesoFtcFv8_001562 [Champsocephalus esox]|uniref:Uncharacterized protein n=1 Tax=Champsocephalus esox TaxID=159716 RepID=A0AAN8D667_9TELE|nr:hypothetical protein CesoFtcFv8_001562 [Champsocephalus esox]